MSNAEDDLYSAAVDYSPALVQSGTVGWASREDHVELGTGDNDGHTFVCVTLYAGKTPGDAVTKGVAQGWELHRFELLHHHIKAVAIMMP